MLVGNDGADGNIDGQVGSPLAMFLPVAATSAMLCAKMSLVTKVEQRVLIVGGAEKHVATPAAIAAVRPSIRDELFPPEAYGAIAAVSGAHEDSGLVDKGTVITRHGR
jgi:hypothetical protein